MVRPRPRPAASRIVKAGGALIWRLREGGRTIEGTNLPKTAKDIEVLIVHRPRYNDWSWPKGKAERGEHIASAAVREVEEETGCVVRLGVPLTTQRYRLGVGHVKEVYYWIGRSDVAEVAARARPPATLAPISEIDETRWVRPQKAFKMLTRRGDRRLLDEAVAHINNRTAHTNALIFLRGGEAVSRDTWEGADSARTLGRTGVRQALRLPSILAAYGVEEVITSPWRRCLQTVAAYATLAGATLVRMAGLSEDGFRDHPSTVRDLAGQWVADPKCRVVCLHRPLLPTIVGALSAITPNALTRLLPQQDPFLQNGEMLVAHIAQVPLQKDAPLPTPVSHLLADAAINAHFSGVGGGPGGGNGGGNGGAGGVASFDRGVSGEGDPDQSGHSGRLGGASRSGNWSFDDLNSLGGLFKDGPQLRHERKVPPPSPAMLAGKKGTPVALPDPTPGKRYGKNLSKNTVTRRNGGAAPGVGHVTGPFTAGGHSSTSSLGAPVSAATDPKTGGASTVQMRELSRSLAALSVAHKTDSKNLRPVVVALEIVQA